MNAAVYLVRRYWFWTLLAIVILYYGTGWIYERFIKSEEDKIRTELRSAVQGARDRSASGVSFILAPDFKGPENVDADFTHSILARIFFSYRKIDAEILPEPVAVTLDASDPKKASARFQIRARGKVEEGYDWQEIAPEYTDATQKWLLTEFRKTNDGWRITRVAVEGRE
jgi:hypothetical protein